MSASKNRQRESANNQSTLTPRTVNERILMECHKLYTDPENGLITIAQNLGLKLLAPRKKMTIMLIGNHSAGKSSFINWYIEEHVQRTGVAIETQGFYLITSGKKRESLTGNATLHLYPHFQPLAEIPGLLNYLQTEISSSKQKRFPLITFIDTPGLVDGDMNYPFDVDQAIIWLGDLVDLIFVFFDPIGQALCKRTMNIVECLSDKHSEKMRFYLSKADEAGHEGDRQRVMMQIVQELCKRPGLNRTGFDMPTIFIPVPNKAVRCVNQIEDVCRDIDKTINQTIQNTLNHLERDCNEIGQLVERAIEDDNQARAQNLKAFGKGLVLLFLGIIFSAALIFYIFDLSFSDKLLHYLYGDTGHDYLLMYIAPMKTFWKELPSERHSDALVGLLLLSIGLITLATYQSQGQPTLSKRRRKLLLEQQNFVSNVVKTKKQALYNEYLQQTVSEHDF